MKSVRGLFETLGEQIAEIEARTAPLRAKRDKLAAKAAPIEAEMRDLANEYRKIEQDFDLFALKQEYAALARALGGKTLHAPLDDVR